MQAEINHTEIKRKSYISTVIVFALIVLALFVLKLYTTIPPFGGGGGGGGNLGYVELASGDVMPMSEETTPTPNPEVEQPQTATTTPDAIMTQDDELTATLNETPAPKKDPEKKDPVKQPEKITIPEKVVEVKKPERKPDPRALYPGNKNNATSQGTANSGKGDQGIGGGDPFGGNGNGPGSGSGNGGGNGDGIGTGVGNGTGPGGGGNGIKWNLRDRSLVSKPQISDNSQETGTVVVEITVDKNGQVVSAVPGAQGSTTTSKHLYELSKAKAREFKFNASPDATELQKGTVTFIYKYKK